VDLAARAPYVILASYWGMYAIVILFFSLHLREIGGSYLHVASLTTVMALATLLAVNIWTGLRDAYGRTRPFLVAGTLAMVLTMAVPFVVTGPDAFIVIVAALALVHCSVNPLVNAYITVASGASSGEAAGDLQTAGSGGFFAASLLGGLLFGMGGVNAAAILGLVGCGVAVVMAFLIEEDDHKEQQVGGMDLSFIFGNRALMAVCTISILLNTARFGFSSLFPLYFISIGGSGSWLGYLNATATLLAILSARRIGRMVGSGGGISIMLAGIGGYLVVFLGMLALPVLPDTSMRLWAVILMWAFPMYVLTEVPTLSLVANHTSDEERARGMGALTFAYNAGAVIGPLAAGFLATRTGDFAPAIAFAAVMTVLTLAYGGFALPRGRDTE
jgi:Na+/melibiose symporter-like transporter